MFLGFEGSQLPKQGSRTDMIFLLNVSSANSYLKTKKNNALNLNIFFRNFLQHGLKLRKF